MTNEEKYSTLGAGVHSLIGKFKTLQSDRADNSASDWVSRKTSKHSGSFSANNPYFTQLDRAGSKADEDALFELAVKWEAEQAGYQQERADKYADLQEQRAYDDPTAVVSRNRRAGINSDLVGASGAVGSGSGSSVTADMPSLTTPTDNTSRFSNQVDRHSMILGAVDSVSGLLGAFSSLGSAVTNSISTLAMLPIAKRAGELSNQLAHEMRPHQVSAAQEAVRGAKIANESADLSLINQSLGTLNTLSGFITPETSDEDATNILSSLGFGADRIPTLKAGIKQWHSNPLYQATWKNSQTQAVEADERAKAFTNEFYSQLFDLASQSELLNLSLDNSLKDFELKVAKLLNTDEYASQVADLTKLGTSNDINTLTLSNEQIGLMRQYIKRDSDAFVSQLDFIKSAILTSKNVQYEIRQRSIEQGRPLTQYESSLLEAESYRQKLLMGLGSRSLGQAKNIAYQSIQTRFYNRMGISNNGNTYLWKPTDRYYEYFMNTLNFTNYVNGDISTEDVSNGFVDFMIEGVKLIR